MPGRHSPVKDKVVSPGPASYNPSSNVVEEKSRTYGCITFSHMYSFGKVERSKEGKEVKIPGPGQYDTSRNSIIEKTSSPSWG